MNKINSKLEEMFLRFASFCHEKSFKYVFVGGITIQWLGVPRNTFDIDVILDLPVKRETEFVAFLKEVDKHFSIHEIVLARREKSHFTVFHSQNPMFRYDIRIATNQDDFVQIDNAIEVNYKGVPVRMNRPEDAVVYKLRYGGEQDINDATSILIRQYKKINFPELKVLADRLKVLTLLNKILMSIDKTNCRNNTF
ncbi:MAG: DUF6036 family nucleotidyltransferase [Candidatus Ranarchaeia archaeon]